MAKFCIYCGGAMPPIQGAPQPMAVCLTCGRSFLDPMAPRPGGPAARAPGTGGMPALVWVIVALAAVPVVVAVIGILAAIAIPNFIRYQARSKQSECTTTLKAFDAAQRAHRRDTGAFATSFPQLGLSAPSGNRYAYVMGLDGDQRIDANSKHPKLTFEVRRFAVQPVAEPERFTVLCIGNVDNDASLDVWGISSDPQEDGRGRIVAAGTPFELINDLTTE